MADLDTEDDRYKNVDVDSILSRVERRPLTFTRKRSLCQAPEFLKRLTGEDTLEEGGNLRLECKVVGFPKPTLRWFRDEEEITENERYTFEALAENCYTISIPLVSKCDEAAYKCKAENKEGAASSLLFVHIKGKSGSKSPKKSKTQQSPSRRTVSFPPLIPTIVERIVEEEKATAELETLPPSPLTSLYDGVTMKQKNTRPQFLGDWAFVKDVVNNNHTDGLLVDMDDDDDMVFLVTNREGDLHDSSSDDSKSESGSPDERKPEEVSIASLVQQSDWGTESKTEASSETTMEMDNHKGKTVDINRNSTDTKHKSKVKVAAQQPLAPPISPPTSTPIVLPTATDTPRSSSRPLFTKRISKPKKLIVRKRQTPSAKDLCSSPDVGLLLLLVCFVTFVSLCVDLNPGRFLSMIFSGYVIYAFVMALLTADSTSETGPIRQPT